MRIYSLNPNSTTQKTAIRHALGKGYSFRLTDQDGTASITNAKGDTYQINDWQCDCADSFNHEGGSYTLADSERHVCKHVLWLSQLYPCPDCSGYAMLRLDEWKHFECVTPDCRRLIAFQLVKAQRQQSYRLQEQETDTIKTHHPINPDAILQKATEASQAIFSDKPTPKLFDSRFGVSINPDGDLWKVYCVGFLDSTHNTKQQAIDRAERLEILEASYADRRTRANYA